MLYLNVKELLKNRRKTKYWLVQNMHSDYKTISDMMDNKTSGIRFETIEKLCILLDGIPLTVIIVLHFFFFVNAFIYFL